MAINKKGNTARRGDIVMAGKEKRRAVPARKALIVAPMAKDRFWQRQAMAG
jgi:hypothetical protein